MKKSKLKQTYEKARANKNVVTSFWILFGLIIFGAFAIAQTIISDTSIVTTGDSNATSYFGNNITLQTNLGTGKSGKINIFSGSNVESLGQINRSLLQFYADNTGVQNSSNRPLSIDTHAHNGSNVNHVTFYSALNNGTSSPRAFQWLWGEDTDGLFSLVQLDRIQFPENWNGFFQNDSRDPGIDVLSTEFRIDLDSDDDGSAETFSVLRNGNTSFPMFQVDIGSGTTIILTNNINLASGKIGQDTNLGFWDNPGNQYQTISWDKASWIGSSDSGFVIDNRTQINGELFIGDGTGQTNVTLTSPDNTEYNCGVSNGGAFECT